MKEIWKDIAGYEGIYQVSSTGLIKSLDRISYKGDKINQLKGRLLKPYLNLVSGYLSVSLSSDGIVIAFTIHRLVANAFIPNPNEYREVNHISGIKIDNSVENLEWCTRNHNIKHAYDIGLRDRYHKRKWGIIKPIDAMIMKEARAAGFLIRQIASYWKINETSVGDVLKGKHWTQRV